MRFCSGKFYFNNKRVFCPIRQVCKKYTDKMTNPNDCYEEIPYNFEYGYCTEFKFNKLHKMVNKKHGIK
jgi:hypothetical protein